MWPFCQTAERDASMNPADISLVGRAADILQSVPVSPVLARPLDRGVGDGRSVGVLGLGLGDRHRQNPVVLAASPRRRQFEEAFWSGQSLEELYKSLAAQPGHSTGALFVAAMREWKRSLEGHARSFAGLQMRIEKVMNVAIAREVENMERRLLVLATVGSAGPFIGLFGTVAGIMTSFQSIAASQNTSLAVVAPGIAEVAVRDRNRPRCRHPGDDFL